MTTLLRRVAASTAPRRQACRRRWPVHHGLRSTGRLLASHRRRAPWQRRRPPAPTSRRWCDGRAARTSNGSSSWACRSRSRPTRSPRQPSARPGRAGARGKLASSTPTPTRWATSANSEARQPDGEATNDVVRRGGIGVDGQQAGGFEVDEHIPVVFVDADLGQGNAGSTDGPSVGREFVDWHVTGHRPAALGSRPRRRERCGGGEMDLHSAVRRAPNDDDALPRPQPTRQPRPAGRCRHEGGARRRRAGAASVPSPSCPDWEAGPGPAVRPRAAWPAGEPRARRRCRWRSRRPGRARSATTANHGRRRSRRRSADQARSEVAASTSVVVDVGGASGGGARCGRSGRQLVDGDGVDVRREHRRRRRWCGCGQTSGSAR